MKRRCVCCFAVLLALSCAVGPSPAAEKDAPPAWPFGPYFLGHESDPAMDYGGRTVLTLYTMTADALNASAPRLHFLAPFYEFPMAMMLYTMQHELHGHGARCREFGIFHIVLPTMVLFALPDTMEQWLAISTAGTEANSVLSRRILMDMTRPNLMPASTSAMLLFAKLDLPSYIAMTPPPRPGPGNFEEQAFSGHDIAGYLALRQATQRGFGTEHMGEDSDRRFRVDFDDPGLDEMYRQVREVALWNTLDPMLWSAMFYYLRDHVIRGQHMQAAPALSFGRGFGLAAGTRGTLEPQSVSRFLDLFLLTPAATFTVYGRDLRSIGDTAYGYGASIHRMALGRGATMSLSGDIWENPRAPEALYEGTGWNAAAEVEFPVSRNLGMGMSLKAGYKNGGYFMGLPVRSGPYFGCGFTATF